MVNNKLQIKIVVMYVWKQKAYIPVQDQYESGIFVGAEPVYISSLSLNDLVKVVQEVQAIGHKKLPIPKNREEIIVRKDPVLKATGARSWKELARSGSCYSIDWTEKQVRIDMSRLDKQGRWEYDPNKVTILPPDAPLEEIVQIILKDINDRNTPDMKS